MALGLGNENALITDGASGIGRATAIRFAEEEGANVFNYLIAAFAASWLVLAGVSTSALAQNEGGINATPTPSSMMLPAIPQIQLQPLPAYGPAPLTVGFMVSSIDPETVLQTFTWNFGDGQVSMLPPTALFHTYTTPGSYVVTVTATTADGHQASSLAGITVTRPAQ